MADGSRVAIADVVVGDLVAAWDLGAGQLVSRGVTDTLPHTDTLYEAYFSDGSVMSVTEDHRFWSLTGGAWVELQELDRNDVLTTPNGVHVTLEYLDLADGEKRRAWDLTIEGEHNFFVAGSATATPVLVHNSTAGFFCRVAIDATVASDLVALNRRLIDGGNSGSVGDALVKLGVSERRRMTEILRDVATRDSAGLGIAERMALNLAADAAATAGIARREIALQATGSANSRVYYEKVLGDPVFADIWGSGAQFQTRQDQVRKLIDEPQHWDVNPDVNAKELAIAEELKAQGRSVLSNPLSAVPDRPRGDAFVEGIEADFKQLSMDGTSPSSIRSNITDFARSPQGESIVVDARPRGADFDRVASETNISQAISIIDNGSTFPISSSDIERIDILISNGETVTWTPAGGFE